MKIGFVITNDQWVKPCVSLPQKFGTDCLALFFYCPIVQRSSCPTVPLLTCIIDRPSVAGSFLQTALSWIKISSKHSLYQTVRACNFERMFTTPYVSLVTCHESHVMCHMSCVKSHVSHVMCHLSHITFLYQ